MDVRPGYKQTNVGAIPDAWECERVGDAAASSANAIVGGPFGSDLVSADYSAMGVPVIRGQNMAGGVVSGDFVFVSSQKAKSLSANLAHPGDLVFTQRGTLGQVAIVPDGRHECYLVSQSQMKVSLNRARYDPCFVRQYFASRAGQKQIALSAIQTGVPHTNLGILRAYRFPAPPLREQRAVADALSDVDTLLAGLDRLIAKKRDLKQAAMQQLLTGQTRLPGFQGEWESVQLGEIALVLKGNGLSRAALSAAGSRPCLLYGELFTTYGRTISTVVSRTDSTEGCASNFGDVLMPGSTTTSGIDLATASALLVSDVALGGDINVIRSRVNRYHPVFLANYLSEVKRKDIAESTQGITIHHLYGRDLLALRLELPSTEEQTSIANVLSDMDAELTALEARRDKTRALKQGMMQELLTGRTRLVRPEQEGAPVC